MQKVEVSSLRKISRYRELRKTGVNSENRLRENRIMVCFGHPL